ncbi:MAG: hypothetical protein HGA87_01275 [Desulfobulbaceae bacterium]|nr:hypothetical protein [Desulfobulbaceae bacterium]
MEAIALLALCDFLVTAAPYAACISLAGLAIWYLAPYMEAYKPYQGDNDEY